MKTKAFDVQPLIRDGQQGRLTPPKDARGLSVMLRAGGAVWQWKTKDASGWTAEPWFGRWPEPHRLAEGRRCFTAWARNWTRRAAARQSV